MKRFKVLLLCAVMVACSLSFLACGKTPDNDGFVEVYSVTYDKTTLNSKVYFEFGSSIEITDEEYNNTQNEYKIRFKSSYILARDTSSEVDIDASTRFSISLKEISKISTSDYYFSYKYGFNSYCKYSVKKIDIKYISVKILNERSILVKDVDGFETLVNTDFFVIEYFKK